MTVRGTDHTAKGQVIPRFALGLRRRRHVALDGGFETGRIYDVVYRPEPARPGFGW